MLLTGSPFLHLWTRKVEPGYRVVWLSEDPERILQPKLKRAGLTRELMGDRVEVVYLHEALRAGVEWEDVVRSASERVGERGLVVVDTLSSWASVRSEDDNAVMMEDSGRSYKRSAGHVRRSSSRIRGSLVSGPARKYLEEGESGVPDFEVGGGVHLRADRRSRGDNPVIPPAASGWRPSDRAREFAFYAAAGGLAVYLGASVVTDARTAKILILLPALVIGLAIPPEKLFVAWLFCAPIVQGASAGDHHGHVLYTILFLGPPLIFAARAATGALDLRGLWDIDALPALYVGWILVSVYLVGSEFQGGSSSLRAVYTVVGIGIIAYYLTALGKTSDRFPIAVAGSLLWSGVVVAILALVDAATRWNLWNTTIGGTGQVRRVASTLGGPVPLGTYLGAGVAFAVAILLWKGPRSLRLPATLLIGLSIPALYFTYTRGPILAIAGVSVFMALVANRARWPSLLAFATVGVLVFAAWGHISSSAIYKERLGVTATVTTREKIQHESVALFRQRPLFGWGYNTFDQLTGISPTRDPQIQNITSHDTYLTVLVELGVIGLGLLVLPWVVISRRALAAARRGLVEPWIVAGCVGTAVSFWIGALTYDARFFSLSSALPWITLGLARSTLRKSIAGTETT